MPLTILHSLTMTTPDDPAYENRPSHWNQSHLLSGPSVDAIAAGTQTASSGTLIFSNANGVTFGLNGQTLTASAAGGGGGNTGSISAGTTRGTLGEVVFANSNGVSFGVNGQTVTASHNALTSQSTGPGALAAGTQTATSGTLVFADSNGFTLGMSGSSQVTLSYQAPGRDEFLAPVAAHAGTSTAAFGQSSLYLQPFQAPEAFSGNRLERLVSMSFSSHTRSSTVSVTTSDGATTASASTSVSLGNTNSYIFSASAALYAPGAGASSTRLESYYSNSLTFGATEAYTYRYSGHASFSTNHTYSARATAGHSVSFGAISQIDTAGNFTTTQWTGTQSTTASVSTTSAASVTTSTSVSCSATIGSVLSGLKAMVMPFATSFSAGGWWLADIAITSSTSSGSNLSVATISRMNLTTQTSAYWPMGFTTSNKSNMLFMGQGALSVQTAALPATIAFSDISARSNEQYFFALRNQSL